MINSRVSCQQMVLMGPIQIVALFQKSKGGEVYTIYRIFIKRISMYFMIIALYFWSIIYGFALCTWGSYCLLSFFASMTIICYRMILFLVRHLITHHSIYRHNSIIFSSFLWRCTDWVIIANQSQLRLTFVDWTFP